MNVPFFRVWDVTAHEFIINGMFTLDNRFMTMGEDGHFTIAPAIEIDVFTGRIANDGNPVYQNSRVQVESQNEFGSWRTYEAGVIYDPHSMCYVLDEVFKNGDVAIPETVSTTKILAVIGHTHI